MSEPEPIAGRIDIAPEVLTMIAEAAIKGVPGVLKVTPAPGEKARLFRRSEQNSGLLLAMDEDRLTFDIHLLMDPKVNLVETSRAVQTAVFEAMDKMVGVPVAAVNVYVEDVLFNEDDETS